MIAMQHLRPDSYKDYALKVTDPKTKKETYKPLDPHLHLTSANLLKNRRGSKNIFLLDSNLDTNVWTQLNGVLVPKETIEDNLPW
jgi:hypothetical protein